jgi:hypothetical protein
VFLVETWRQYVNRFTHTGHHSNLCPSPSIKLLPRYSHLVAELPTYLPIDLSSEDYARELQFPGLSVTLNHRKSPVWELACEIRGYFLPTFRFLGLRRLDNLRLDISELRGGDAIYAWDAALHHNV